MITVGVDLASSRRAVEIAGRYPSVLAAVGLHPGHLAVEKGMAVADAESLRQLTRGPRVAAIGEVGLDTLSAKVPVEVQEQVFRFQLRLARQEGLPVLLHVRGAFDALFDALELERFPGRQAVVHYFVGNAQLARRCVERDLYLSFGKPLVRSEELQRVAEHLPLERLLIETDAYPRGASRWTEPADVRLVAEKLAQLRGLTVAALGEIISANLARLFNTRW